MIRHLRVDKNVQYHNSIIVLTHEQKILSFSLNLNSLEIKGKIHCYMRTPKHDQAAESNQKNKENHKVT